MEQGTKGTEGGRKMHVNWPATLANRAVLALTEINEHQ